MAQKKLSLQEQLLKSGLTSDAKAKQIRSEKHKQEKQAKHAKTEILSETQQLVEQAKQQQILRDKELSLQLKAANEQKALLAQIRQLIQANKITIVDQGIAYHFNDQNKIKTLYLSEDMRQSISRGRYAIIKWDDHYAVVGSEVANKIKARDPSRIMVHLEQNDAGTDMDEEYSAYPIPDDLMW